VTDAKRGAGSFCELAIGACLGAAIGAGLLLDVAGGLGAFVFHRHWTGCGLRCAATLAFGVARHVRDPEAAWPASARTLLPSPALLYALFALLVALASAVSALAWTRLGKRRRRPGFAQAAELRAHLSVRALRRRAPQVRPSLRHAKRVDPLQIGVRLGRDVASRKALWASLEDSFLVLGPPRSNKTASLVIPGVIETPGPAVVTSIRPEILRHTAGARNGPIEVFDPQDSSRWPSRLRWSPVADCEDPLVAIRRARGFVEGTDPNQHRSADAEFFDGSARTVIRCYLHAAALGARTMTDVAGWAARPGDPEPVRILDKDPRAAAGWSRALHQAGTWDPRTKDGIWATVAQAFESLADPRVLEACSPPPGEAFDTRSFLRECGTLYVLGTPEAQRVLAPLISAFTEDVIEQALEVAAESSAGRLDPPLSLWLDEAANIAPLESLPQLLSAGGGSGICTIVVLQSLAQARARWGTDKADAIWDASTVRVVFGGLGHAEDLARISRLAGETDEEVLSKTRGAGGTTWSSSPRQRPVLPPERLRTLREGRAVVLHRRTPPVEAVLPQWWRQRLAPRVLWSKAYTELLCRGAL